MLPRSSNLRFAVGAACLAVWACASQAPPQPTAPDAKCRVAGSGSGAGRELTVAVAQPVEPARAPVPTNQAESLIFGFLYETLVGIDCEGELRPGLAASWRSRDGDRLWELQLDSAARFWDGTPVTAADAAASLLARGREGIAAVGVHDAVTLTVRFERPQPDGPQPLADPALAVGRAGDGKWPLGTGPYRIEAAREVAGDRGDYPLIAVPLRGAAPTLRFRVRPGADERDMLDEGADLLVTRDAAVIDYARMRSGLTLAALPWDRTYVLLAPAPATNATDASRDSEGGRLPPEFREQLARDAVRGTARPHRGPSTREARCEGSGSAGAEPRAGPGERSHASAAARILYREADPIARQLAGRIVALAGRAGAREAEDALAGALVAAVPGLRAAGALQAMGLADRGFERELRNRSALLYVVDVPSRAFDPCAWPGAAGHRTPWLRAPTPGSGVVIPLVDTRPYLVAREGLPALLVDGNGALRFEAGVMERSHQ